MSSRGNLLAAGMPAGQAIQIGSSLATGLKATGSTKATALQLSASVNIFGTVSSGTGAQLPPASGSPIVGVYNGGSNTLAVYSDNATDVINALSAGAAFSVTAGKSAFFLPHDGQWIANLSG